LRTFGPGDHVFHILYLSCSTNFVFCFLGVTVSPQIRTGGIIVSQTDAVKSKNRLVA
jgi:hypothetical protein